MPPLQNEPYPIFKNIEKERGATIDNVAVPFTDNKKQIGVVNQFAEETWILNVRN